MKNRFSRKSMKSRGRVERGQAPGVFSKLNDATGKIETHANRARRRLLIGWAKATKNSAVKVEQRRIEKKRQVESRRKLRQMRKETITRMKAVA